MRTPTPEQSDSYEDAFLDGVPCKAIAWVESTHVPVMQTRKQRSVVSGVRTWHGEAILDSDAMPSEWQYNKAIRFVGKVHEHDQVLEVSADVYIHTRVGAAPPRARQRDGRDTAATVSDRVLRVCFTGAGNLPRC